MNCQGSFSSRTSPPAGGRRWAVHGSNFLSRRRRLWETGRRDTRLSAKKRPDSVCSVRPVANSSLPKGECANTTPKSTVIRSQTGRARGVASSSTIPNPAGVSVTGVIRTPASTTVTGPDAKAETTCKTCGGTFEYSPSDTSGVYCSDCVSNADGLLPKNPSSAGKRITVDCNGCGSELSVYPSRVERNERGVFCDMACYGRWLSRTIVGENHHQWAGGPITYGRKWWTIRRQVLERDDYRCQRCGRSRDDIGRNPDVHHLVPVRSFDDTEDAHTLANVIALCRRCHRLVEEDQISVSRD